MCGQSEAAALGSVNVDIVATDLKHSQCSLVQSFCKPTLERVPMIDQQHGNTSRAACVSSIMTFISLGKLLRQQSQRIQLGKTQAQRMQLEKTQAQQASRLRKHATKLQDQGSQIWATTKMVCTLRAQNACLMAQLDDQNKRLRRLESMVVLHTAQSASDGDVPDMDE